MDLQNEKCVMVIDEHLPLGIIANTAAIMGITLGKKMPEVVGADVTDKTGNDHLGIIEFPVPILKGNAESIKAIRERLYEPCLLYTSVMWSVPILFAGKYRPYIYNSFKCRRDYFSCPLFYSYSVSLIFEARRKAAGKFLHWIYCCNAGDWVNQL